MLNGALLSSLFSDDEIVTILSDEQFMTNMLVVEIALARVQAALGVIPGEASERIANALGDLTIDSRALHSGMDKDGIPIVELVRLLREHVSGAAATYVHWGATSQDVMDTVLMLQLRAALDVLGGKIQQLIRNLAHMADAHRHTLMAGRTHAQHALPITFGLKVAGWLTPFLRHRTRLYELKPRLLVVQFGGAAGTLASLGSFGLQTQSALAQELGLGLPLATWHTQRDSLAELAGWLSLVTGSLAKMAQDIILLAQTEVGELRESADPKRGGSSTMPQKNNPIISENIIAAARTNAALLSALHQALPQEHERATGGWQMEWLNLPPMLTLTAAALNKALFLSENLVVNAEQMRRNVAASNGVMLAEALSLALAPTLGRAAAKQVVKTACTVALEQNRHLVEVIREQTDAALDWDAIGDEAHYLGETNVMIDQVLEAAHMSLNGT